MRPVSRWRSQGGARLAWRQGAQEARRRLRTALWPSTQAAVGAALAWLVAHDLLGHPEPFFAPIAAAISLSANDVRRGRRTVQMVLGVTLGIAVSEAAARLVGVGAWQIGVVVLVTMAVAVALGVGFFSEGLMFVNQSVASAVIVIALRAHGTGSERLIDAWVGGAVALAIGVGLFPPDPVAVVRGAEREVLRSLSGALAHVGELLERRTPAHADWTLAAAQDIHRQLASLAAARATARATARFAPRRWRARPAVAEEVARIGGFDLLANSSLSVFRVATTALDAGEEVSGEVSGAVDALASALGALARSPQPWSAEVLEAVRGELDAMIAAVAGAAAPRAPVLATLARAAGRDLLAVLPAPGAAAAVRPRASGARAAAAARRGRGSG